ncbi:MAG: Y-family DNA polymerase [Muribaculum sp.]|nr:Y-family DNA polymerase [Muribaculaceae bacterium]MCM1080944.1 Y-family DNA polymerase [Muribaculum sp.]
MIIHVDCNSFFVSCERAFRPDLRYTPVVVLSNNDGCVCSLSSEAKKFGIKRGDPYFKFKDIATANGIVCFSGNHKLYSDMSQRVMSTLRSIAPHVEVYSVDDAFIFTDKKNALQEFGQYIKRKIWRDTCIPVSVGIAPTKTLGKLASHFAKRYPGYNGVAVIDTDEKAKKALALVPIEDVWGIGRRMAPKLRGINIRTALQLANMPEQMVKQVFSVVGERTWRELNGESCIAYESTVADKQSITASRSFATNITGFDQLHEAISVFSAIVARRLRRQNSRCMELSVFLGTNRFQSEMPQRFVSERATFIEPTCDTLEITAGATAALSRLYLEGYGYKKAGVIITDIVGGSNWQMGLFGDDDKRKRSQRLMNAVDVINSGCNGSLVHVASMPSVGIGNLVRNEYGSRLYTTRINDIITVKAT